MQQNALQSAMIAVPAECMYVCISVIHTEMTFGMPHTFLCCWGRKHKPTGGIFVLLFSTQKIQNVRLDLCI